jgi:hypothetical protein
LTRLQCLLPAVLVLSLVMATSASAQEWTEFYSPIDLFRVTLPGKPTVEETSHTSFYDNVYPARVYRANEGRNRYSITVVDYTDAKRINDERRKACPPDRYCTQGAPHDVRSAMDHAAGTFVRREGVKLTFLGWGVQDRVEGRLLRFTNADLSRTTVAIHMHEDRLYIVEATVPARAAESGVLHHSLQFLDTKGHLVRYSAIYTNGFPAPPREEQEDNVDFVKRTNADFLRARQVK